jgi:hypothetical protein
MRSYVFAMSLHQFFICREGYIRFQCRGHPDIHDNRLNIPAEFLQDIVKYHL